MAAYMERGSPVRISIHSRSASGCAGRISCLCLRQHLEVVPPQHRLLQAPLVRHRSRGQQRPHHGDSTLRTRAQPNAAQTNPWQVLVELRLSDVPSVQLEHERLQLELNLKPEGAEPSRTFKFSVNRQNAVASSTRPEGHAQLCRQQQSRTCHVVPCHSLSRLRQRSRGLSGATSTTRDLVPSHRKMAALEPWTLVPPSQLPSPKPPIQGAVLSTEADQRSS